MKISRLWVAACALAAAGCTVPISQRPGPAAPEEALERNASASGITIVSGRLITDNDAAFQSKLRLVEQARISLDLIYYIYADDYSSSRLSQALIAAAQRGVRVRLLVDYHTNYKRLDLFSHLESAGAGRIEVRFYNRPTRNIVQDVAYMTMGCGRERPTSLGADCSREKFAAVDGLFAQEAAAAAPPRNNISNVNTGASGLFLSGLYSKRPDVMALAVQQGQGIDVEALGGAAPRPAGAQREQLNRLAKAYWYSRTGDPMQRVQGRLTLLFASAFYGEQVRPVFDSFESLLPAGRRFSNAAVADWDHLTDFVHHKLLLADERWLQLGGRNIEDSYHMRPNELTAKYVFMDTDLAAELATGGAALAAGFDRLWQFDTMVATLKDVRMHAPNDFVANRSAFEAAEQACRSSAAATAKDRCQEREFERRSMGLEQRLAAQASALAERAATYDKRYAPSIGTKGHTGFEVDGGARLAYLENLPFDKRRASGERQRIYGSRVGEEGESGKHLHEIWINALPSVCIKASAAAPQRIVLHNAYYLPPANMLAALARLTDGTSDCSNVRVTLLTNSIQSTDLSVVNLLARHTMKAFYDHLAQHGSRQRGARFDYYEYKAPQSGPVQSLHTKLAVLGDDILIGSANADLRSLMMDTNNAMLLRDAGRLRAEYLGYVDALLRDVRRTRSAAADLTGKSREQLLQEDVATGEQLLAKYRVDRRLDADQMAALRQRFRESLEAAYELTRRSLDPAASEDQRRGAQQAFNRLFKAI